MRTQLAATAVTAAAFATIAAALAGTANAEAVYAPDHQITWRLDGGGSATVASHNEKLVKVAPLTTAGTTREGFANVTATTHLTGVAPDTRGVLVTGYQVGCMASFDGAGIGISGNAGLNGNVGINPTPGGGIGPSIGVSPSLTVNVGPGQIVDVPLGKKDITGPDATIRVRNAHIKVDGCIGPVTARSYTSVQLSSSAVDDGNAVYGKAINL